MGKRAYLRGLEAFLVADTPPARLAPSRLRSQPEMIAHDLGTRGNQ